MHDFVEILLTDLSAELSGVDTDWNQIKRRSAIRSGFATVEGCVHFFKEIILSDLHLNPDLHSQAEIAMLREETYLVDSDGNVQTQPRFIPTDANLKFVLRMWCRGTSEGDLDLGGNGWRAFKASLRARNRLVHPKCISDLMISDNELRDFAIGIKWFLQTVREKIDEVVASARIAD